MERSLRDRARHRYAELRNRLVTCQSRLALLGPDKVLARGYTITLDEHGTVLRDARAVKQGQLLKTILKRGVIRAKVESSSEVEK